MISKARALLSATLVLSASCCAPPACAAPLGRLFFTAEQRRALEYRWQLGENPGGDARPTVNGLVWRSAGRSTIWVNGQPHYQQSTDLRLGADAQDPAQVDLRLLGKPGLRLRVGEAPK